MRYPNFDAADTAASANNASVVGVAKTRARYTIAGMLFLITTINFADRAALSVVGTFMQKELGMDAITMGYMFSAFAWATSLARSPVAGCSIDWARARPTA